VLINRVMQLFVFSPEDQFQEPGKSLFQLCFPQRCQALGSFGPGENQARSAQDIEVMGARGFGHIQRDLIAGELPAVRERSNDSDSARIRERLHNRRQFNLVERRMGVHLHRCLR
jgi:hypothetical protein